MSNDRNRDFVRRLIEHEDDLLRFILPLVGCFDDARDVLQNTSIALWDKFDAYDPSLPFLPWAKQFARYEVLKHHKQSRKYLFYTPEIVDSLIERLDARDELAVERRDALRECVKKLPEPSRQLVLLRYEESLSITEAAQRLGRTEEALYQALSRVRRLLAQCIERTLAGGTA